MNTNLFAGVAVTAFAALATGQAFAEDAKPVAISITDKGCAPNEITVPAGNVAFVLSNDSKKAIEWEILSGVKVVFERENILPGFKLNLNPKLDAGDYEMTCGLVSNPKGKLTVTGDKTAAPAAEAKPVDPAFKKPLAEYKAYVSTELDALIADSAKMVDAIKQDKLEEAQALYPLAHSHYERIEPIAESFGDLDKSLDARADDYEKKEDDPGFVGFHRIEKVLFADKKADGLDEITGKLTSDLADLKKLIDGLEVDPGKMVGGSAELIEEVGKSKISGEEDRYSGTDLYDFQANVDGAKKIIDLIRPLIENKDKSLVDKTEANFGKVDAILKKYRVGEHGFKPYSALSEEDRNGLKGPVTTLAEDLSKLNGVLGL